MPHDLLPRPTAWRRPVPSEGARRTLRPEAVVSEALVRVYCAVGLAWSLVLAAVATMTPEGTGWKWGDPLTELHWYATGLGSPTTMIELFGNLALLALPAALAVRLWPGVGRLPVLVATSLAAGASIETLQWLLAVGRVVSPIDALLNAAGAVVAGRSMARFHRGRAPRGWHLAVPRA